LLSVVERFDEEYTKMLQACDAHSTEYVERLKDERTVCKILADLEKYLEKRGTTEEMCGMYIKGVEHI
jgi:translation initiation factor 3 subunit C